MASPTTSIPSGNAAWRYQRSDPDTSWSTPRSVGVWTRCVTAANGRRVSFTNTQFLGGYSEGEIYFEVVPGEPDDQFLFPIVDAWICVGYIYDGDDTRWYYAYEGDAEATQFGVTEGHAYWNWLTLGGGEYEADARGTLFSVCWDYSVDLGASGWIEQARTSTPIVDEEDSRFFSRNESPSTANLNAWGTDSDWTLTGSIPAAVADAPTFPGDELPVDELLGLDLDAGTPSLSAGNLSQLHVLSGLSLSTGVPSLSAGSLALRHVLVGLDLSSGSPTLTPGSLSRTVDALTGLSVSTAAPELSAGTLQQLHVLMGLDLRTGTPFVGGGEPLGPPSTAVEVGPPAVPLVVLTSVGPQPLPLVFIA